MIIFIIVPPGDQLFKQRTLHNLSMIPSYERVICIIPEEEEPSWRQVRPWVELITYVEYDQRKMREMMLDEFENEDVHVIARYDLALTRRLPSIDRLSQCTRLDIPILLDWVQDASERYQHGSVSERHRNKIIKEKEAVVATPSLLNFYRPEAILGYSFLDAPETLIDRDLTMWLLREGFKNVVNYEFACRSVSKITIDRDDAFKLERRYPGLVEAVELKPGKWGTTCQWRRAYDSGS